jgi:hypothetical protein
MVPVYKKWIIKLPVVITEEYHCLSTTYKPVYNILLLMFTPYLDEVIGDHKCERNRSFNDHIFCIRQMLKKDILFIDFRRAYDSGEKHCTLSHLL